MRTEETVLVIVDVQEKFAPAIPRFEELTERIATLVRGCRILDIPVIATEQYPKGLGHTVPTVAAAWGDGVSPIEKTAFSCLGDDRFARAWEATGRRCVLLAGIEAHVCVYQTCRDFLARNVRVETIADAVASRTDANRSIGLRRMETSGAGISSVEMVLFELLGNAGSDRFREISRLVR